MFNKSSSSFRYGVKYCNIIFLIHCNWRVFMRTSTASSNSSMSTKGLASTRCSISFWMKLEGPSHLSITTSFPNLCLTTSFMSEAIPSARPSCTASAPENISPVNTVLCLGSILGRLCFTRSIKLWCKSEMICFNLATSSGFSGAKGSFFSLFSPAKTTLLSIPSWKIWNNVYFFIVNWN